MERLKDFSDILCQPENLFPDIKKPKIFSVTQLLDPKPNHLKGIEFFWVLLTTRTCLCLEINLTLP